MRHATLAAVFVVAATWALGRPAPECPPRSDQTARLSCEISIGGGLGALPADHAAITRIQFLRGSLIPILPALVASAEQAAIGYVVFTYQDGSRDYVDLAAVGGELSVGPATAYPEP
jgi:hypothetical protein